MNNKTDHLTWDTYFGKNKTSFFQKLVILYRFLFISNSVKYYTDKYFPKEGTFIETGAGTSQSSSRINRSGRKLIALDLNYYVLAKHNILDYKVQGNILSLPFKGQTIDAIWNIGVMEHFTDNDIITILKELKRVLKDTGILLIYWPPYFAPYNIILKLVHLFARIIFHKDIEFFPDEINPYRNKIKLEALLSTAGLKLIKIDFNILDLFTYKVIIAKKDL